MLIEILSLGIANLDDLPAIVALKFQLFHLLRTTFCGRMWSESQVLGEMEYEPAASVVSHLEPLLELITFL